MAPGPPSWPPWGVPFAAPGHGLEDGRCRIWIMFARLEDCSSTEGIQRAFLCGEYVFFLKC